MHVVIRSACYSTRAGHPIPATGTSHPSSTRHRASLAVAAAACHVTAVGKTIQPMTTTHTHTHTHTDTQRYLNHCADSHRALALAQTHRTATAALPLASHSLSPSLQQRELTALLGPGYGLVSTEARAGHSGIAGSAAREGHGGGGREGHEAHETCVHGWARHQDGCTARMVGGGAQSTCRRSSHCIRGRPRRRHEGRVHRGRQGQLDTDGVCRRCQPLLHLAWLQETAALAAVAQRRGALSDRLHRRHRQQYLC